MDLNARFKTVRLRKLGCGLIVATGLVCAVLNFPNTSGSQGTLFDQVTTLFFSWGLFAFLSAGAYSFLLLLILSRDRIVHFSRSPYPWLVSMLFAGLGIVPWLIYTGIYWSQFRFAFVQFYISVFLLPIFVITFLASAFLTPRLTVSTTVRILISGAAIWLCATSIWTWLASLITGRLSLPPYEQMLVLLAFYWFACLVAWAIWSFCFFLARYLPLETQNFLRKFRFYKPDENLVLGSIGLMIGYPMIVLYIEVIYNSILEDLSFFITVTYSQQYLLRGVIGLPAFLGGVALLVFIVYSTLKFVFEPSLVRKLHKNPTASIVFMLFWLFSLWWLFYTSMATYLNFLSPGEFELVSGSSLAPNITDFFFYTFEVMTNSGSGEIKAIGTFAHVLKVCTTFTGFLLFALLIEIIAQTVVTKNLIVNKFDKNGTKSGE